MPNLVPPRPLCVLTFFLLAIGAFAAHASENSPTNGLLAQATDNPDTISTPQAATAESEAAPATPPVEELPRMSNRKLAFWGVGFMLTVCVLFSVFAGYGIYSMQRQKK